MTKLVGNHFKMAEGLEAASENSRVMDLINFALSSMTDEEHEKAFGTDEEILARVKACSENYE